MVEIVYPTSAGFLRVEQQPTSVEGVLSLQGWVDETTGPILGVIIDCSDDNGVFVLSRAWTANQYFQTGLLKLIVNAVLTAATTAGYETCEFRTLASTSEVVAHGAELVDKSTVRIPLNPPGAFMTWLVTQP